jgi:hypothetical protein
MKKLRQCLGELFLLAILVMTCAVSVGQLTAEAGPHPCEGLSCLEQWDCGMYCFCHRPSGLCVTIE